MVNMEIVESILSTTIRKQHLVLPTVTFLAQIFKITEAIHPR